MHGLDEIRRMNNGLDEIRRMNMRVGGYPFQHPGGLAISFDGFQSRFLTSQAIRENKPDPKGEEVTKTIVPCQ